MSNIRNGMPATELSQVTWFKSSQSGPTGGNCVEVAFLPGGDGVCPRDPIARLVEERRVALQGTCRPRLNL